MMQSPMYLSIVPRRARISRVIGDRKPRLISRLRPCGLALNVSEIVVKPRMSENISVSMRVSPPSCSRSGWAASCVDQFGR